MCQCVASQVTGMLAPTENLKEWMILSSTKGLRNLEQSSQKRSYLKKKTTRATTKLLSENRQLRNKPHGSSLKTMGITGSLTTKRKLGASGMGNTGSQPTMETWKPL